MIFLSTCFPTLCKNDKTFAWYEKRYFHNEEFLSCWDSQLAKLPYYSDKKKYSQNELSCARFEYSFFITRIKNLQCRNSFLTYHGYNKLILLILTLSLFLSMTTINLSPDCKKLRQLKQRVREMETPRTHKAQDTWGKRHVRRKACKAREHVGHKTRRPR